MRRPKEEQKCLTGILDVKEQEESQHYNCQFIGEVEIRSESRQTQAVPQKEKTIQWDARES